MFGCLCFVLELLGWAAEWLGLPSLQSRTGNEANRLERECATNATAVGMLRGTQTKAASAREPSMLVT